MTVQILHISCLVLLLGIHRVSSDAVPWSYTLDTSSGPNHWKNQYPDCGGVMQSPINIDTKKVLHASDLAPFDLSQFKKTQGVTMTLVNKEGHTAEVMLSGTPMHLNGGNLPSSYKLDQFHFHWGSTDQKGSEHSLNGKHYPMEMHLVHHQIHLDNLTDAASHPYGLAVLGYFFQIGEKNDAFDALLSYFDKIKQPDQRVTIPAFAMANLLPKTEDVTFYRYFGSLTTPPCYETVIWSMATDIITLSEDQINQFRGLLNAEKKSLVNDYRPTQPLNHRTVTTNHKQFDTCHNNGHRLGISAVVIVIGNFLCQWMRLV